MITFVAMGLTVGIVIAYYLGTAVPLWAFYAAMAVALGNVALSYKMRRMGIAAVVLTSLTLGALVMTLDLRSNGLQQATATTGRQFYKEDRMATQNKEGGMATQRLALAEKLHADGTLQDDEYAVVTAMTLGQKQHISRRLKQAYSVSGASHVFALSGMHVGILFGLLMFLLPSLRRPKTSSFIATAVLWAYVALIGMQPSLLRATMMLSVYALCLMTGRKTDRLSPLCLAATIMLIIRPQWLFNISFQMSFAAVLGIATCCSPLCRLFSHPSKNVNRPAIITGILKIEYWLWSLTMLSLSAQIFTLPLIVHYFGRISIYSLLANLIVSPLATLIVAISLLTIVLAFLASPLPLIGGALSFMEHPMHWSAALLSRLVRFMNMTLTNIAALPGSHIDGLQVSVAQTVCLYLIILTVVVYFKRFSPWAKR